MAKMKNLFNSKGNKETNDITLYQSIIKQIPLRNKGKLNKYINSLTIILTEIIKEIVNRNHFNLLDHVEKITDILHFLSNNEDEKINEMIGKAIEEAQEEQKLEEKEQKMRDDEFTLI